MAERSDSVSAASIGVGIETLRANPMRTLLSTLGVIMGALTGISLIVGGVGIMNVVLGVTAVMRSATAAPIYAAFSVGTVVIAVGASVLVGLGFGIYPALQAARLAPVEAIHRD